MSVKDMLKKNAVLVFVEPHVTGGDSRIEIPARVAASYQRRCLIYKKVGKRPNLETALEDFLIINWAWVKEEERLHK
jgi:hypothetical protein